MRQAHGAKMTVWRTASIVRVLPGKPFACAWCVICVARAVRCRACALRAVRGHPRAPARGGGAQGGARAAAPPGQRRARAARREHQPAGEAVRALAPLLPAARCEQALLVGLGVMFVRRSNSRRCSRRTRRCSSRGISWRSRSCGSEGSGAAAGPRTDACTPGQRRIRSSPSRHRHPHRHPRAHYATHDAIAISDAA